MNNIENILRELKIEYKVIGKEAVAVCPYHSPDRHPSWSVNLRTGLHQCFSCGARGSLAHLVSHVRSIGYSEAAVWVNTKVGWARADQWREDTENKNFASAYLKISESDLALFTDPPQQALAKRNLSLEAAQFFGVRWDTKDEAWITPIREPYTYELWGWQKKNERIFRNYPAAIKKSKTLFGIQAFANGSTAIIVESPLDVVRLGTTGYRSGLSSWGVSISDYQLALVHERSERVVLAFDNDSAGISETTRICREFVQVPRLAVFNYGIAKGKDPGELSDEEIRWGMEHAISAIKWKAEHPCLKESFTRIRKKR